MPQVGYLPEVYKDARSAKHKKICIVVFLCNNCNKHSIDTRQDDVTEERSTRLEKACLLHAFSDSLLFSHLLQILICNSMKPVGQKHRISPKLKRLFFFSVANNSTENWGIAV